MNTNAICKWRCHLVDQVDCFGSVGQSLVTSLWPVGELDRLAGGNVGRNLTERIAWAMGFGALLGSRTSIGRHWEWNSLIFKVFPIYLRCNSELTA